MPRQNSYLQSMELHGGVPLTLLPSFVFIFCILCSSDQPSEEELTLSWHGTTESLSLTCCPVSKVVPRWVRWSLVDVRILGGKTVLVTLQPWKKHYIRLYFVVANLKSRFFFCWVEVSNLQGCSWVVSVTEGSFTGAFLVSPQWFLKRIKYLFAKKPQRFPKETESI